MARRLGVMGGAMVVAAAAVAPPRSRASYGQLGFRGPSPRRRALWALFATAAASRPLSSARGPLSCDTPASPRTPSATRPPPLDTLSWRRRVPGLHRQWPAQGTRPPQGALRGLPPPSPVRTSTASGRPPAAVPPGQPRRPRVASDGVANVGSGAGCGLAGHGEPLSVGAKKGGGSTRLAPVAEMLAGARHGARVPARVGPPAPRRDLIRGDAPREGARPTRGGEAGRPKSRPSSAAHSARLPPPQPLPLPDRLGGGRRRCGDGGPSEAHRTPSGGAPPLLPPSTVSAGARMGSAGVIIAAVNFFLFFFLVVCFGRPSTLIADPSSGALPANTAQRWKGGLWWGVKVGARGTKRRDRGGVQAVDARVTHQTTRGVPLRLVPMHPRS